VNLSAIICPRILQADCRRRHTASGGRGLHTGAAFDLTQKGGWEQLGATEREVIAHGVKWVK